MPAQTAHQARSESRVARKRRAAYERIIAEAERLMRRRPIEDITVGDITEAADIGHGTFYLHFKSKNEVLIPITRNIARRWDEVLQASFSDTDDPAEVVCLSARHMGRAVLADPLWRWLLQHSGVPVDHMRSAIGRFAARDFKRGYATGRFQVADVEAVNRFLVGGFVASLLASFDAPNSNRAIDHMAELLLRTLGVNQEDAARIAHQPISTLTELYEDHP